MLQNAQWKNCNMRKWSSHVTHYCFSFSCYIINIDVCYLNIEVLYMIHTIKTIQAKKREISCYCTDCKKVKYEADIP